MHVDESDALRADLAACLRALSGGGEADGPGVEALIAAFMERCTRLQRAFAAEALRDAGAAGDDNQDAAALRAEVDALRRELADKESLLTTHRANVKRWLAECASVQEGTTAAAGLEPQVATDAHADPMDADPT